MMKQTYFQILKSLIQIPSPSGHEKELVDFIIENYLIEGWVVERDVFHNILFRPVGDDKTEKLPLLYAHLNTHPNGKPDMANLTQGDIIWLDESGEVNKKHDIQMGFDDKAGVAAILYLMKHTNLKFRALLVVQEEESDLRKKHNRIGGGGIEYAINHNLRWVFEKSAYVLSLDRRFDKDAEAEGENGNQIITTYGNDIRRPFIHLCSPKFAKWVVDCSDQANHPMVISESKNVADVYNIRSDFPNLDCVNLSIGYYCEHNYCEHLNINETLGVIRVVQECLTSRE